MNAYQYANITKQSIKALRNGQSKWMKVKAKHEKVTQEAQQARAALIDAKSDSGVSTQQVIKVACIVVCVCVFTMRHMYVCCL